MDVDIITPPPPPRRFFLVPTHKSFFKYKRQLFEISERLKLVSVPFSCLLLDVGHLEKSPREKGCRRASCKAPRWDKGNTIGRVCIVQYRITLSLSFGQKDPWPWSGLRQKGTILLAFLRWPLDRGNRLLGVKWIRWEQTCRWTLSRSKTCLFSGVKTGLMWSPPSAWPYIRELEWDDWV